MIERTPAEALNSLQFAYPEINDERERGWRPVSLLNAVLAFDFFFFANFVFFFGRRESVFSLRFVDRGNATLTVRGLTYENKYPR